MPLPRVRSSLKGDQVVEVIRRAILEGELRPGERIVESALARELGVSQTPVREALAALSQEGLVIKFDHRGSVVSSLDEPELRELLTLRAVLEGFCARLAAERCSTSDIEGLEQLVDRMLAAAEAGRISVLIERDLEFHQRLYELGGHSLLREVLSGLQQRMRLALALADAVYSADLTGVAESHRALIDALRRGDPAHAEALAKKHVVEVLDLVESTRPE